MEKISLTVRVRNDGSVMQSPGGKKYSTNDEKKEI
jgi:hypothetical protein